MACDVGKGKRRDCKNAVSGFKKLYLANYDEYNMVTSSTTTGHLLTDIGDLVEVFGYDMKNTGNNFVQTINSSSDNGTTFYNQVLTFILTKLTAEMEFQVKMMAYGSPILFVELRSGQIFAMGLENGCDITGTAGVGGTMDSLNGYTLTATANEKEPIFYLDSASITALKALVSTSEVAS
jgi:hypothetical protein